MMRFFLTTLSLLLCTSLLHAQAWKTKRIPADTAWQDIDSLTILDYSMRVYKPAGDSLPQAYWQVENHSFRIRPQHFTKVPDSLLLHYQTLPYDLGRQLTLFDSSELTRVEGGILHSIRPESGYSLPTDNSGLKYSGDFSRGISLGNNQNLSLNSGLHLQMNGLIGDGIRLRAAITDENLPIQPEGNTQQLREFDRIYIQIEKDYSQLTLGDYRLQALPESYFMRFDKKLEGASYSQSFRLGEKASGKLRASAAVNRGKFARYSFNGQEGNQGPYRLQGANGESFVIVLSGTERIYLDGQLLTRGAEADYVIDYNRGEITFTHRRLITAQSRIIAEYEYSDNRYLRSLYMLQTDWQLGRSRWQLQYFSQQDSRSRNSDELLTDEQYQSLVEAGDDPLKAVVSGIDSSGTATDPIRYTRNDTLVQGQLYSILLWTPDGSGPYTARFSDLGPGNGNYIRLDNTANGIVYAWVAPDSTGHPQGRYEPVLRLIPPQQHQLISLQGQQTLGKTGLLQVEATLSQLDENRFSPLDKEDDQGLALFARYRQNIPLGKHWQADLQLQGEFKQQTFNPINPYRPPEFQRDWNSSELPESNEMLGLARLAIRRDSLLLQYGAETLQRADGYGGFRQMPALQWQNGSWKSRFNGSFLQTDNQSEATRFDKLSANLARRFPKLHSMAIEAEMLSENNRRLPKGSPSNSPADTLSPLSNRFEEYRLRWRSPQSKNFSTALGYTLRFDYLPKGVALSQSDSLLTDSSGFTRDQRWFRYSQAREWQWEGKWLRRHTNLRRSQLNWNLKYRKTTMSLTPSGEAAARDNDSYLGRLQWQWSLGKGSLRGGTSYQISSGSEQKLLFVYKAVNPGEGVYQHIDFNGDGLEQNNEFVIAPNPDQANYLRIAIFTGEFIRTNNLIFSQNLYVEPRAIWRKEKGWRGLLSRFSLKSGLQIDQKTPAQSAGAARSLLPALRIEAVPDSLIIALNLRQQHLLNFRAGDRWNAQWQWNETRSRIVLTTGFESRALQKQEWLVRWTPSSQWTFRLPFSLGSNSSQTENFPDRNYDIAFRQTEPSLSWIPAKNWRIQSSGLWSISQNREGEERARRLSLSLGFNYRLSSRTSLLADFTWTDMAFEGETNSPAGFAILNGLLPGTNFQWGINLDQQLPNNLRLSLLYNGRKNGELPVVHTGQARLTALF